MDTARARIAFSVTTLRPRMTKQQQSSSSDADHRKNCRSTTRDHSPLGCTRNTIAENSGLVTYVSLSIRDVHERDLGVGKNMTLKGTRSSRVMKNSRLACRRVPLRLLASRSVGWGGGRHNLSKGPVGTPQGTPTVRSY